VPVAPDTEFIRIARRLHFCRTITVNAIQETIKPRWAAFGNRASGNADTKVLSNPNSAAGKRTSLFILLALTAAAVLPVWIPSYPPMTDLPQHAAQVGLLHQMRNPHFPFSSLYELNWFTPYLLGYLLIYLLSPICGIVTACKLVISFFVVGFPLASALLLDFAGVDIFWAILTIPCVYGFAFQWGFLNFLIAAPLGLAFLWLVGRSSSRRPLLWTVLLALSAVALFFCHALVCGFFLACGALFLLSDRASFRDRLGSILPLTVVLPVALLWIKVTLAHPAARRPMIWDLDWFHTVEPYYSSLSESLGLPESGWGRLNGFFPRLLGVFPSLWSVCVGAALFLLPLCGGLRFSKRPAMFLPLLACIALLLLCPGAVFGTDYVYPRFTMFILPLFLFALRSPLRPPRHAAIVRSLTVALILGFILLSVRRSIVFSRQARGFQYLLSAMEPGQRVLSLAFNHEDGVSIAPTFLHLPQWYAAQKQGVVDPSAAMMHPELVVFRKKQIPKAVLWDFEWDPEEFDWMAYSGGQYRYFVVRSNKDEGAELFSNAPCPVVLRRQKDDWWLYERTACPGEAAGALKQSSR